MPCQSMLEAMDMITSHPFLTHDAFIYTFDPTRSRDHFACSQKIAIDLEGSP